MRFRLSLLGLRLELEIGRSEPGVGGGSLGDVTSEALETADWTDPLIPNDRARTFGFY